MAKRTRRRDFEAAAGAGSSPTSQSAATVALTSTAAEANRSGLYKWQQAGGDNKAEFRLDVDGTFPLMAASGTEIAGLSLRVDWVARPLVAEHGPDGIVWTGPIIYKNGDEFMFLFDSVRVARDGQLLRVVFSGGGPDLSRDFAFSSAAYRPVEFEYDSVEGVTPVTRIRTFDHPDRPGSLTDEELSIETVFRRAGFDVRKANGDSIVPLSIAGDDEAWSDAEMHDAMQVHFSRFADRPQWSLWTLFAARHEQGKSLGGIMFDQIGPNHRQGTALFLKSFIANSPASDEAPEAWVRRMVFWTAVHEMGHAFNLAHAWDKADGPWMPMASGYDLLTYMNYPYFYRNGDDAAANTVRFFRDFSFRFNDEELLFLRHAPEHFVEMGGADWFDNHAFKQADASPVPRFRLTVQVNREKPVFAALEPVVTELKLTNVSGVPALVPDNLLHGGGRLTVIVKREGKPARQWVPFAHYCWGSTPVVLMPGQSLYDSHFVAVGGCGWLIDEPGRYQVQACLRVGGEDVVSAPLSLRVNPPRGYDEDLLAQDFYTQDVGRVLTFDGTRFLDSANDTLREVIEKFPDSLAAVHAGVALSMPGARSFKTYAPESDRRARAGGARGRIERRPVRKEAVEELAGLLGDEAKGRHAAEALGHIDYCYYVEACAAAQNAQGEKQDAQDTLLAAADTLAWRGVPAPILAQMRAEASADAAEEAGPRRRRAKKS